MTKSHRRFILLLPLILLCIAAVLQAQPTPERPKIGIVLSGGGAKGFAHVPILALIDSLGIPIDYVAGTSMGALIGSLYAIGYSPQQIEELIIEEDWMALLDDAPLRRNVPILEKDVKQNRLASVGIKKFKKAGEEDKTEVLYPSAFISGQKVFDIMLSETKGYHDSQDFLSFPRGFLCVAADLKTGREVVFTSGVLPDALRSTMSIPTLFSPHVYDGKMLIDGGALNNLPANHLKALGCDIIIGVDVSMPFSMVQDNPSIADILGQTGMFTDAETKEERRVLCDVYIEPEVLAYGVTSFDSKKNILKKGYEAAQKALPDLQKIAELVKNFPNPAVKAYSFPDSIIITELSFTGLKNLTEKYLRSKFDIPIGQKISCGLLDIKNKALFGTGKVEQNHFLLHKTNDPEKYRCEVRITEKKAETTVGIGFHYDSDLKTGILLSADIENFLFKGSRLLANFVISERPRLRTTFLLDAGRPFSFGMDLNMHLFTNSLYKSRKFVGRYRHFDKYLSIYASRTIGNSAVLKWGGSMNHSNYDREDVLAGIFLDSIAVQGKEAFGYLHLSPFIDITVDRLDDAYVPTKGVYAKLKGSYVILPRKRKFIDLLGGSFFSINGQWKNVWPVKKRFTILSDMHFGANLFNRPTPTYFQILGGAGDYFFNNQMPFLGYRYQEIFIRQFVATAALTFRYQLTKQIHTSLITNIASYNTVWDDYTNLTHLSGMGLNLIWMTPFGPVSGTLHSSFETADFFVFVSVGFNF